MGELDLRKVMEQKLCMQVECLKKPMSQDSFGNTISLPHGGTKVLLKDFPPCLYTCVAFAVFLHLSHIISKSYTAFFIL